MPALLTASSTLQCPHGGTVTASPGSTKAQVDAAVLRGSDTFSIAGCAFSLPSGPHPCTSVNWIVTAAKVTHGGDPVLTEASVGLCIAADQAPQGVVLITATQALASGL